MKEAKKKKAAAVENILNEVEIPSFVFFFQSFFSPIKAFTKSFVYMKIQCFF